MNLDNIKIVSLDKIYCEEKKQSKTRTLDRGMLICILKNKTINSISKKESWHSGRKDLKRLDRQERGLL